MIIKKSRKLSKQLSSSENDLLFYNNVSIENKLFLKDNKYFEELADTTNRLTNIRDSILPNFHNYNELEQELFYIYYGMLKNTTAKELKTKTFLEYIDNNV